MAISSLIADEAASTIAKTFTATATTSYYQSIQPFDPGIYSITCSSGIVAVVDFYNSSGEIVTTGTTASGTVSVNLAQAISKIGYYVSSGSNVLVSITLTGQSISSNASGTLDTITTTSTYNTTGQLYVVCVGGAGGGSGSAVYRNGASGGTGGFAGSNFFTNTSTPITIGTGGNGGAAATAGNAGGVTNFGNLLSANGGGGATPPIGNTIPATTGASGSPSSNAPYLFMSTPGSTGGNGASQTPGGAAGGAGSSGFVYVLRGL